MAIYKGSIVAYNNKILATRGHNLGNGQCIAASEIKNGTVAVRARNAVNTANFNATVFHRIPKEHIVNKLAGKNILL